MKRKWKFGLFRNRPADDILHRKNLGWGEIYRRLIGRRAVLLAEKIGKRDDIDIAERFWAKVNIGELDQCWEWQGSIVGTPTHPYGGFGIDGKSHKAHRVAWELTHGPIPDGLFCCHHCDNARCCNPAHLFIGTHSDNMRDAYAKGRLDDMRKLGLKGGLRSACSQWHKDRPKVDGLCVDCAASEGRSV